MNYSSINLDKLQKHSILHYVGGDKEFIKQFESELNIIHNIALKQCDTYDIKKYILEWMKYTIEYFRLDITIKYNESQDTMFLIIKALTPIVFVHIPKTGGSTFVNLLLESLMNRTQKNMVFDRCHLIENIKHVYIQHLDFKQEHRPSKCYKMFTDENDEFYKNKKVFTIVRHPIDRLISEYIFQSKILSRKNAAILKNLHQNPKTFEEYIKCPEVWNYQVAFLTGKGVADQNRPSENDLKSVIRTIDTFNIKVGITEDYQSFIEMFQSETCININKEVNLLKKAPDDIKTTIVNNLTKETKEYIIKTNELDYALYKYAKNDN
jgi:hypothetical protein